MAYRIESIWSRKLTGVKLKMSYINNRTGELWHTFMMRRKEIQHTIGNDLYSMQIYSPNYFDQFNPNNEFVKWAAIEVTDFKNTPSGFETFELPGGVYAVFLHKGSANTGAKTFQYIFQEWLPSSGYRLDNRPHFELLGEKYKNNDPSSEEEFWIPVQKI